MEYIRILCVTLIVVFCISCQKSEKLNFESFGIVTYSWKTERGDSVDKFRIIEYVEISKNGECYQFYNNPNFKQRLNKVRIPESYISLLNKAFTDSTYDSVAYNRIKDNVIYCGWNYCYVIKIKGDNEKCYYFKIHKLPKQWMDIFIQWVNVIQKDTIKSLELNSEIQNRLQEVKQRLQWTNPHEKGAPIKAATRFRQPPIKENN